MEKDTSSFPTIINGFANLAYTSWNGDINEFKDCLVIDLLNTPVQTVEIVGFPNLKRFRAPRCDYRFCSINEEMGKKWNR